MEINAKINYKGLKNAIKALSQEYDVKVGLLSGKGGDDEVGKDLDLAALGAIQEFGATIKVTDKMRGFFFHKFGINLKKTTETIVIPPRSFLTMPLTNKGNKIVKNTTAHFGGEGVEAVEYWIAEKGDIESVAQMVGASALEVIQEGFETSGWGQWAPNSPLTIANKGSANPLEDTGYLKNKITFEVSKNDK